MAVRFKEIPGKKIVISLNCDKIYEGWVKFSLEFKKLSPHYIQERNLLNEILGR